MAADRGLPNSFHGGDHLDPVVAGVVGGGVAVARPPGSAVVAAGLTMAIGSAGFGWASPSNGLVARLVVFVVFYGMTWMALPGGRVAAADLAAVVAAARLRPAS